ncbi:cyclic GMP-AMP synthase-like isoform X2 [Ruditapes philippinarum]|uniref:cyclic GMP-AMP synthase-like isoform X2 n=1 Tax=Ruditapes philippinarum TaxID=129788 RepID=UPI00295AADA6|nr:cyclic GMP-AMP synthase-like isoform X2 [Ruditapes philippinarum]
MEKLKNNINFERSLTSPGDKYPIRQQPILREQANTRENNNSSVKNNVVKQYSSLTLRRIGTASESKLVKQNWRYLGKSTSQKADKQKRGQLKNKDHTDLSSSIKPKGCNETVNSSETTKKNELLDIMAKENVIDNISVSHLRLSKYRKTELNSQHLDSILKFYSEKVTIDVDIKNETHDNINELLDKILNKRENRARFSKEATTEGSYAVGVKVGKAEELDYSVDILINCQELELSDEPVDFEFEWDDIDSHDRNKIPSTFVHTGKRYFPNERRSLRPNPNEPYVPDGFKAVYVSRRVNSRFPNCCVPDRKRTMILPYYLLSEFHDFVNNAVYGLDAVSLNRGARGPAVTLTIQQDDGPNISVDITPKLTLSNEIISVTDFGWPRRDTKKWLTKEKIDIVKCQQIYLVPKGDKYWKISYANCENELLRDIDDANTWRKACLRIMKKKLMQWKSKSTGLKEISSYLLKTTLLWLCEILPKDEYWYKEELANRYLNFLQEFAHRLHKRHIGEYFNPTVNLLENKDDDCIDELKDLIEEEISLFNQ